MAMSEYICAQCWHSFEADADLDEALKCPSCGAEQPAAGGASASEAEADSEEGAEHPAVPDEVRVESSEGEAVVSSGEKGESPSSPESDESGPAEEGGESGPAVEDGEEDGDWLDGIDPAKCGWRVRSGVLTYNFHGIDALQNWCSGKKGLDSMEVSIESIGIWRNLQEFRRLLRKQDPITAFREMGLGEETPAEKPAVAKPAERKPMEPVAPQTEAKGDAPKTEPRSSAKKETPPPSSREDSGLRRANKPSVRSTGEFTFKVGESPAPSGKPMVTFGGGFVVGLLFGLALWFLGLLSATGIEPMSLF